MRNDPMPTWNEPTPEDVELLCRECHAAADEARAAKGGPRRDEPPEDDSDPWL